MIVHFTKRTNSWLYKNYINPETLRKEIIKLCKGRDNNNYPRVIINIKKSGKNSEYCPCGNIINIGKYSVSNNHKLIVKGFLRVLIHEVRHFIQYKILKRKTNISYNNNDFLKNNNKYFNDPLEKDARKFERKHLDRLFKTIYGSIVWL
jgi:hypothetical protein